MYNVHDEMIAKRDIKIQLQVRGLSIHEHHLKQKYILTNALLNRQCRGRINHVHLEVTILSQKSNVTLCTCSRE